MVKTCVFADPEPSALLRCLAVDLFGWEAGSRVGQFVVGCFGEVDVQYVGEAYEVEEDVGKFLAYATVEACLVSAGCCGVGGEPLEEFGHFADLADEGEDQGFRVVELSPVAFLGEHAHAVS
jgi:hypothetical protein